MTQRVVKPHKIDTRFRLADGNFIVVRSSRAAGVVDLSIVKPHEQNMNCWSPEETRAIARALEQAADIAER